VIANCAFLAALTVFLLAGWLAGELRFLAPHKFLLFHLYAPLLGGVTLVLFLNLCAIYYSVARWLFLRETAGSCCTSTADSPPTTRRSRTCGRS